MEVKQVTHVSVFSHLNNKWQYIAQLYESGGMDEDNTDTQVSVLMYWVFRAAFFICEIPYCLRESN
jgi:hypothetical protein